MTRYRGVIPLDDPANIGPALGHVRAMLGRSQRSVAMGIARRTGRDSERIRSQLWAWESGRMVPGMPALKPFLDEIGIGLAFTLPDDGEDSPA